MVRNIVLGIIGGVVGGIVFGLFGFAATSIIGDIIVSVVGACLCVWIARKIAK